MIEKNVKLWLGDGPLVRVPVSQFDSAWQFVFSIIYNSVEWTIPTGATAVLNGKKPDGNVFAFSGTISDNKVTVDCDVQMTAVAGDTICELSILSDGKTVGTANFTLAVEAAPKSPDDVSSDSTLPAYAEMLEMFSGDITDAVDDWLNDHSSQIGGLTNEAKQALLTLLAHVAYTDEQGQTYLDALEAALYPPADLVSISAVFNQGSATIYDTDTLDTLKQYLTVTALYSDSTTEVVTAYTLSGTLTEGTSTITVEYGGKTTTFTVIVSEFEPELIFNGYAGNEIRTSNTSVPFALYNGSAYDYGYPTRVTSVELNFVSTGTFVIGYKNISEITSLPKSYTEHETITITSDGHQTIHLTNPLILTDGQCLAFAGTATFKYGGGGTPQGFYYSPSTTTAQLSQHSLGINVYGTRGS